MLLPKANKTSLVKLLRSKGFVIPSIYRAEFSRHKHAFWLRWTDKEKNIHSAYYSAAASRPVLMVDSEWLDITLVEAIHFDLIEAK